MNSDRLNLLIYKHSIDKDKHSIDIKIHVSGNKYNVRVTIFILEFSNISYFHSKKYDVHQWFLHFFEHQRCKTWSLIFGKYKVWMLSSRCLVLKSFLWNSMFSTQTKNFLSTRILISKPYNYNTRQPRQSTHQSVYYRFITHSTSVK